MLDRNVEYLGLPIYQDELAQALGFTRSDLEANRSGRIGAGQLSYQRHSLARATVISLALAVMAAGCIAGALAIGITTVIAFGALVLAACLAAWIGINAWYLAPVWRDVNSGIVSSVEGLVRGQEKETDVKTGPMTSFPIWSYYWTVDGRDRFWVPGKAYAVLMPARHRLYFLPISRRIVGIEPLAVQTA